REAMFSAPTGALDSTFAGDGSASNLSLLGYGAIPYPGGGFIVFGEDTGGSGWEFGASRIDQDGNVIWDVYRPMAGSNDMAFGAAIDASGRVLLAGHSHDTHNNVAIMRLTSTGTLDTSFNAGGTPGYHTIADAGDERFFAVGVQSS